MLTHLGALLQHFGHLFERLANLPEAVCEAVEELATPIERTMPGRVMTLISDVLQMSTCANVVEVVADVIYVRSRTPLHMGDLVRTTLQSPGLGTVWFEVTAGRAGCSSPEFGLRPAARRATQTWFRQRAA